MVHETMSDSVISLEASLPWDSYFRKFVNRRDVSLISPRIFPAESFKLPKNSVIHYLPTSFTDVGPSMNNPIFKDTTRMISTYYVDKLAVTEGNPRHVSVVYSSDIRRYHNENRRIRRVFNLESSLKDPEAPLVINYCYIERKYKYLTHPKKDWYSNNNWIYTITKEIQNVFKANPLSNQFLFVDVPKSIPSLPIFLQLNKVENNNSINKFNSFSKVLVFHLFNLIKEGEMGNRHAFNDIDKRALDKVNIVFSDSGYFSILNLGTLVSWVKSVDNSAGKNPRVLRAYLIRFLLSMMKVRSEDIEELIQQGEEIDSENIKSRDLIKPHVLTPKDKENDGNIEDDDSNIEDDPDEETETPKVVVDETNVNIEKKEKIEENKESDDKSIRYDEELDQFIYDDSIMTEEEEREYKLLEEQLNKEIEVSDNVEEKREIKEIIPTTQEIYSDTPSDPEEEILYKLDDLVDSGVISPSDYVKMQNQAKAYKSITINNVALVDYINVDKNEIQIKKETLPDNSIIQDKRMLQSSLTQFDKKYVKETLQKDIAAMVVNFQKGGVCVTDFKVQETEDSSGIFHNYEIKVNPIKGKPSVLKFRLPKISEEGTYVSNNVEYRLRKQKRSLVIVKVSPTRVALTTSYGKLFVDRSETKKFNYQKWLTNNIRAASLDKNNSRITESRTGNVFYHDLELPYLYTHLAQEFRTFTANGIFFYLDYHKRIKRFQNLGDISAIEQNGYYTVCGSQGKDIVCMDNDSNLFVYKNKEYVPLPSIEEITGLNTSKKPIPMATLSVMGKAIPVGLVLAYQFGFTPLLKMLNVEHKIVSDYRGYKIQSDEYDITFRDKKYVFKQKDKLASIILNGFNDIKNEVMDYDQSFFDRKDVYFNLLDTKKAADRYLKEIDLLFSMFIDPISLRILTELNQPKTFTGLLLKSCEMLIGDSYKNDVDGSNQRIAGYDRMASLVYTELVRVLRAHNSKTNSHLSQLSINPNDILLKFLNDPSNIAVNGLNPFQNMRQIESVTYTGIGGRSKDTMSKLTRKYHKGDIGVVSEATSDSSDVGINIYMSANPGLTDVYGLTDNTEQTSVTDMMSSVFNTMPCIEKDDLKRANFASIQADANVFCVGYESMPVRTGYDSIIPYRVGSLFATMADEDGQVVSITNHELLVTYQNGSVGKIPIGRQYGKDGGLTVPHLLKTDLKIGDTFKKGDVLAYNVGYFQRDPIAKDKITLRMGVLANVAILENPYTFEDGSMVTENFRKKLVTHRTEIRNIRVDFSQEVHNVVSPGTSIKSDEILCIIEDSVTSKGSLFDASSIELLKKLANKSPKAKINGIVEKIEVYYNGDKENMSKTLKALVTKTDKQMLEMSKIKGNKGHTGKVQGNYLVEGNAIEPNQLVISFYISGEVGAASGDKIVVSHQMKSVIGNVITNSPTTESGDEIDVVFGARSINARIVNSPYILGTTNTLLVEIGKKAYKMFTK